MYFRWTFLVFSCVSAPVYLQYSEQTGCYDCNFAPSGYIRTSEGSAKEVGYVRCALQQEEDFAFVDAPPCSSNRCFIRLEDNGLEYRGCADPANLPLNVDPNVQCKYQGPGGALWYFCFGLGCNEGQIGQDEEHCGQSSGSGYYGNQARPATEDDYHPVLVNNRESLPLVPGEETTTGSEYYYYSDTDYTETTQPDSEYTEYTTQPSPDHEQNYYKPDNTQGVDSKSQMGRSDHTYQKSYTGNSDAAYNRPDINFHEFNPDLQMGAQHPEEFLRQFGFWYFLMPAYWMYYFGYQPDASSFYNPYETGSTPPRVAREYDTTSSEYEYNYNIENNADDGHRYVTETDTAGYDTSAFNSLVDQFGNYNPCQGCEDNPSGLYSDITRSGQFIQCGCAVYDGVPCACCYPFPMTCPNNTIFSDVTKTCVRFGDYPQHG